MIHMTLSAHMCDMDMIISSEKIYSQKKYVVQIKIETTGCTVPYVIMR